MKQSLRELLSIYVITGLGFSGGRSTEDVVRLALEGGATTIQLREKDMSDRQLVAVASVVRDLTQKAGALFLVNDRVDIALAVDADGVHLGQDDIPPKVARRLLGKDKVIGVTVETAAEATAATEAGADYLGTGPVYSTGTKADAGSPYGPGVIARIKAATHLPVVGVGGINHSNAGEVRRAGADGIAVVSAVVGAEDITRAARELREAFLGKPICCP